MKKFNQEYILKSDFPRPIVIAKFIRSGDLFLAVGQ